MWVREEKAPRMARVRAADTRDASAAWPSSRAAARLAPRTSFRQSRVGALLGTGKLHICGTKCPFPHSHSAHRGRSSRPDCSLLSSPCPPVSSDKSGVRLPVAPKSRMIGSSKRRAIQRRCCRETSVWSENHDVWTPNQRDGARDAKAQWQANVKLGSGTPGRLRCANPRTRASIASPLASQWNARSKDGQYV
jgi:hypothetical protein